MRKEKTIDICHRHLFDSVDQMQRSNVSQQLINRVLRIRSVYTLWLESPLKKEKEIRDYILKSSGISQSEAYEDIRIIKQLLGDFGKASKNWHRFKFNCMIEESYALAKKKDNVRAMIMASDKYGKYNQIDKEDAESIPWSDIMVQPFVPTSDPSVIGIKPVSNIQERISALKKKYGDEIQDVDYEDIGIDPDLIKDLKEYE